MRKLLLFSLLLLFVAVSATTWIWMRFVERERIELTEFELTCADWQGEELRFAVITDIHARPEDGEYLDRVVQMALAQNPHAVLLLGDYLNDHHPHESMPMEELVQHLKPLTALPCFAVLGNHDYYHGADEVAAALRSIGIMPLEGGRATLRTGGGMIDIGGIRCCYTFDTPGAVPQPRAGVPLLLLSHTPVGAQFAHEDTALVLAGHSHGGQVCWPDGSPIWMADGKTPAEWAAGAVRVQGRLCYVSRGIGTSTLPIRLFCRPELMLLRVH